MADFIVDAHQDVREGRLFPRHALGPEHGEVARNLRCALEVQRLQTADVHVDRNRRPAVRAGQPAQGAHRHLARKAAVDQQAARQRDRFEQDRHAATRPLPTAALDCLQVRSG